MLGFIGVLHAIFLLRWPAGIIQERRVERKRAQAATGTRSSGRPPPIQHRRIVKYNEFTKNRGYGPGDLARSGIINFPNKLICHGASTK
jgi:hypothetical protein